MQDVVMAARARVGTHYETLAVRRDASPQAIRMAYRNLIRQVHPDLHADSAGWGERAAAVTRAYAVLGNAGSRAEYDARLRAAEAARARRRSPLLRAWRNRRRALPGLASGHPGLRAWTWVPALVGAAAVAWVAAGRPWDAFDAVPAAPQRAAVAAPAPAASDPLVPVVRPAPEARQEPGAPQAEAVADAPVLAALRQDFQAAGSEEARRALMQRKAALLAADPLLRQVDEAQAAADRAGRTFALLRQALVVPTRLRRGPGVEVPVQLQVPELGLVLGSHEAQALLAGLEAQRERLRGEVAAALAAHGGDSFAGPGGERVLRDVVRSAATLALGTDASEQRPASWFESPGRHGVVDVVLPQGFRLAPLEPPVLPAAQFSSLR